MNKILEVEGMFVVTFTQSNETCTPTSKTLATDSKRKRSTL